jgi:hypothetical protein
MDDMRSYEIIENFIIVELNLKDLTFCLIGKYVIRFPSCYVLCSFLELKLYLF